MEQSKKTEGRESRKDNDLFFTCSLIEYIARKTKNKRADVVNALGRKNIVQEFMNICKSFSLLKLPSSRKGMASYRTIFPSSKYTSTV